MNENDPCVITVTDTKIQEIINGNGLNTIVKDYFKGAGSAGKLKLITKAYYFYETGDFITAMVYSAMALWVAKVDKRNNTGVAGGVDDLIKRITDLYRSSHDKYADQVRTAYSNKEESQPLNIVDTESITDASGQPLRFANVVGMNSEKQLLRTKFIFPNMFPYLYTTDKNSVLMYGPPGTGKTFIAKASALEFNESGNTKVIFIEATASELRSKWEGGTEQNIKQLWVNAQAEVDKRKSATGTPHKAILFLDEIEALASDRTEFPENSRAVTTLLQVMDGISSSSTKDVMVMAATNLPWVLDPAILRRLPGKIMVGLPDFQPRISLITDAIIQKFYKDAYNPTSSGAQFRQRLKNARLVRIRDENPVVTDIAENTVFVCGKAEDDQESFDCYLALISKLTREGTLPKVLYKSEMKRFFNVAEPKLLDGITAPPPEPPAAGEVAPVPRVGVQFKQPLTESEEEQKNEYERIKRDYDFLFGESIYFDLECDFMNPRYFNLKSRFQSTEDSSRAEFDRVLDVYRGRWEEIESSDGRMSHFEQLDEYFQTFAMYHFGVEPEDVKPGMIMLVKYIHYLGEQTGPKIGTRVWTHSYGAPIQGYKTSRFAKRDFGYSNSDISNFMNDFYGKMALEIIQTRFDQGQGEICQPVCDTIGLSDCGKGKCFKSADDGKAGFGEGVSQPMDAMFLTDGPSDIFVTYNESTFKSTMNDFFPTITSGILDVWKFAADGTAPAKKNDVDSLLVKQWNRSKVF
jgi:hypothetical protein